MTRERLVRTTTRRGADSRRTGVGEVADEVRRLMPRDRWLLHLLHDHHTFTTEQITAIAFPTPAKARRRLNLLHDRGVLARFRHAVRPGSQSWRCTLGPLGAAVVAASHGKPIPRPAAIRASCDRLAVSPRLAHLLGVNQFFCALIAHARRTPGCELLCWRSEQQATQLCGGLARPDGHGVWSEDGRRVPFWLEHDTGAEPLSRLVDKLRGYAELAAATASGPVLFWLPSAAREDNVHTLLRGASNTAARWPMAVATAAGGDHPAAPVWRVAGAPGERVRLIDLPVAAPGRV